MAHDPDPEQALTEAFVEEHVQRALAPYRGRFPPELIEHFAEELRELVFTHPVASRILSRVRPHQASSGAQPAPGVAEAAAPAAHRKANAG
jgi:hypothetical protein